MESGSSYITRFGIRACVSNESWLRLLDPPCLPLRPTPRSRLQSHAATKSLPYQPFQPRPKASEWRWLEYAEPVPILGRDGSPLWKRIKKLGMVDQGTGSTFSALADRGLVSVQWHRINAYGQGVPHLRISTKGRQLARSWTGAKAYKAPPAGTLKYWRRPTPRATRASRASTASTPTSASERRSVGLR